MNKIMRLSGFQLACSGSAHKASALPLGPRRLRPQEEEEEEGFLKLTFEQSFFFFRGTKRGR